MLNHYGIEVSLDPSAQTISARADLSWKLESLQLEFFLHRNLEVSSIEGPLVKGYHRVDQNYVFAIESVKWVVDFVHNPGIESAEFSIAYSGHLPQVIPADWHTNRLSADWTELGMYGPWYPWNNAYDPFTYQVSVEIPPAYTVVGLGETKKLNDRWLIQSTEAAKDIIITAAKEYHKTSIPESYGLSLYYVRPDDKEGALSLTQDGIWLLDYYRSCLGKTKDQRHLSIVIAPRDKGGGYVRPGMVVMQVLNFHGLAHELAHLWWAKAPVSTWEDWLNESFAEYTAVKAVAAKLGAEKLPELMTKKRERSQGLPPIKGIPREHEKAWFVLYDKGALLLHDLENLIGQEAFDQLLRLRIDEDINTTQEFLALLARIGGQDTADLFDSWLETK